MSSSARDDSVLVLPPLLCAGIDVYARVNTAKASFTDWSRPYDKRFKAAHRFAIADTRGRLDLTVPIARPQSSRCSWADIMISTHGAWWDVHRVALESAYGRTPYFEFYIDRFLPMLTVGVEELFPSLRALSTAWDSEIRSILLLPSPVASAEGSRLSAAFGEGVSESDSSAPVPYWQVRAGSLGFIPGLSVLDLIFNLGPEAVIYLDNYPL